MQSLKLAVDGPEIRSTTTIQAAKDADPEVVLMQSINDMLDETSRSPDSMIKSVHDEDERVTKAVVDAT